jgi:hypothetical protein
MNQDNPGGGRKRGRLSDRDGEEAEDSSMGNSTRNVVPRISGSHIDAEAASGTRMHCEEIRGIADNA